MTRRHIGGIEPVLVEVVCKAVRSIVEWFDDETLVIQMVRRALLTLDGECRVTLRVAPALAGDIERWARGEGGCERLQVIADPAFSGEQCRLDDGRVSIDASVQTHMSALRQAMEQNLRLQPGGEAGP